MKLFTKLFLIITLFLGLTQTLKSQTTQTFNATGAMQTFTVPVGVTSVTIDIAGAQGGLGGTSAKGGRLQCTLTVTIGQVLNLYVGKQGIRSSSGGWNGGGGGGFFSSYQGGDASDIRIGGTDLSNRVIVAGGGGGSSVNNGSKGGDGGEVYSI